MIKNVSIDPHHSLHWLACPAFCDAQIGPCPAPLGPAGLQEVHHQDPSVFWTVEGSYPTTFPEHGQFRLMSAGSKAAPHLDSIHTAGPTSAYVKTRTTKDNTGKVSVDWTYCMTQHPPYKLSVHYLILHHSVDHILSVNETTKCCILKTYGTTSLSWSEACLSIKPSVHCSAKT